MSRADHFHWRPLRWPWASIVPAAAVGVSLPLCLCQPPWIDADYYATAARVVLSGGVLECDVLYLAPPAMVWLRMLTESLLEGRSEWVRALDVGWMAAALALLSWWGEGELFGRRRGWIFWTLLLLYLGTPVNCHAQPDTWMLLPATVALHLRRRQAARLVAEAAARRGVFLAAAAEGLACGAACLFKPYALLPLAALLPACWYTARPRRPQVLGLDLAGWTCGGGLVLALWLVWLAAGGGWACFFDNLAAWGAGYNAQRPALAVRLYYLVALLPVWSFIHVPVLVLAARSLGSAAARRPAARPDAARIDSALYAAFYLGWVVEGAMLQWAFHYHLLPALLVGSRWFGGWVLSWPGAWPRRAAALIAAMAVAADPLLVPHRLGWWGECFRSGSSPSVRDALSLPIRYPPHVHVALVRSSGAELPAERGPTGDPVPPELAHHVVAWRDLERVAEFLRRERVGDGELTCYHTTAVGLYPRLGVRPATRWLWPAMAVTYYPQHEEQIRRELAASRQRFVVSDLLNAGVLGAAALPPEVQRLSLPEDFPAAAAGQFPWQQPIVFRAGRYAVHRVTPPILQLSPDLLPWH